MAHPVHSPEERLLPKIWVHRLLSQFHAELWELNAQLTLPPIPGSELVFRQSPRPLAKPRAPRAFERALELGRDPDIGTFAEPEIDGGRYNLFRRVATHVPFSEDWLFQSLKAYLAPQLPGITYATALVERCLKRLGLCRLSRYAAEHALENRHPRSREVIAGMQAAIGYCPEPIHLELLVALYHEAQWFYPNSPTTTAFRGLCRWVAARFAARPEFAKKAPLPREIEGLFGHVLTRIAIHGHRSPAPIVEPLAMDDPQWRHNAPDESYPPEVFIPCEPFERFQDADLTLALRKSWFIPHLLYGKPTCYCEGLTAFEDEALAALDDILEAVPISSTRWCRYAVNSAPTMSAPPLLLPTPKSR